MIATPIYHPQEDIFLSLVHVALKIWGDTLSHLGQKVFSVSGNDAAPCIPHSLYMFLHLLYEGQSLEGYSDEDTFEKQESVKFKVHSIAQDVVYGGKKWIQNHICLATRSRQFVNLIHQASHSIS